jgi:glycosyltransferase involved in cell wall biosynthesis
MNPQLAVVVCSLGNEPGLVEAVRSVRDQGGAEVVVINSAGGDAGSTLGAAGEEVPVIEFQRRLFAGAARNAGIDATRAPYVAFLAADCVARPGWVAERLRLHREGAAAVASVMDNLHPTSRSACASFLLLHHRRMAETPADQRVLVGLSYDRGLFERFGPFREDLERGEDTEFNLRLADRVEIVFAEQVRTAHRYPTAPMQLFREQYERGTSKAARRDIPDPPGRWWVARDALRNVGYSIRQARRVRDRADRRRLLRSWPLLPPAALAYALGSLAPRRGRSGRVPAPGRHVPQA